MNFQMYCLFMLVFVVSVYGNDKITCYSCRSTTKNPMVECEEPFANPSKVTNVTCATKKGIKPRCIRAIGKTKTMPKFVVRDCSYLSGPDKKCGDFNLDPMNLKDARGFNGCVILCNGTLCNSTPSRHLTGFQFWWFTSLLSFFALFLLGIQ